jgi:beta-glucosidase
MAAYNGVNGTPCTDNRHLLSTVLRDEWGFDGLVVSDWGAVNDRVAAVAAGTDLEMPGGHGVFDREVRAALDEGRLPADSVRACADRVLDLVARAPGEPGPPAPLDDHDGLARAAAAACTVLLTNDGTLPLSAGATVALIGTFAHEPRYQGTGSSRVNPTRLTTAAEEFSRRGLAVRHAPGYDPDGTVSPQLRADAVAAAAACDVAVVMVGLPHVAESEGFDREHLRLPDSHDALVEAVCAANPRTVVAVSNGAPVLMPWAAAPAAILECYLGGQAGGAALVDVLCGDAEPGGRLAETFPVRQEDVAADPYFPGQSHQVQYREGLAVGYRHAVTSGVEPLFPFGHGLGYSTFEFGPAEVGAEAVRAGDPVRVTVPVTNTGDRAGSTVVQVYLHDRTGRVARPRRWLAGFAKVHLDPGETALTRIDVESRAFAVFDTGTWRIPAGEYALEMGTSSADILQTVEVTVIGGSTGGDGPAPLVAAGDEQFARRLGRGIPAPRPVRPYSRMSTIGQIAGNPVGRLVRGLSLRVGGYYGEPDPAVARMILRSVDELPLRSVAMLSEGRVGMDMIDALVHVVNGRPDRALTWAARRGAAGLARRLRSRGLPRG